MRQWRHLSIVFPEDGCGHLRAVHGAGQVEHGPGGRVTVNNTLDIVTLYCTVLYCTVLYCTVLHLMSV